MTTTRLLYVADPMCSWCWGFASGLAEAEALLRPEVGVQLVLGGLATDSDAPMPDATRRAVRSAWRAVAERTGAEFNDDFWERCAPRRSTYPACRAVLAAGDRGREMFATIQRAYYTQARNPSDREVLIELAAELGFAREDFAQQLDSARTEERLQADLALAARLGVSGFPSVALERDGATHVLTRGWVPVQQLMELLRGEGLLVG